MSNGSSQPWLHQHGRQVQLFGTVRQFPLGLSYEAARFLPAPEPHPGRQPDPVRAVEEAPLADARAGHLVPQLGLLRMMDRTDSAPVPARASSRPGPA
jgi:hypothetical protein